MCIGICENCIYVVLIVQCELDGEICENCSYAIYTGKDIMCFGVARDRAIHRNL